jgi:hypothetical protein
MRRTRAACCARAASGHAAAPLSRDMKARRLIENAWSAGGRGRVFAGWRLPLG